MKKKKSKSKKSKSKLKKKAVLRVHQKDAVKEIVKEVESGAKTMADAARERLGFILSKDRT